MVLEHGFYDFPFSWGHVIIPDDHSIAGFCGSAAAAVGHGFPMWAHHWRPLDPKRGWELGNPWGYAGNICCHVKSCRGWQPLLVRSCSQGFPSMKTRTTVIFSIISYRNWTRNSKLMQSGDTSNPHGVAMPFHQEKYHGVEAIRIEIVIPATWMQGAFEHGIYHMIDI